MGLLEAAKCSSAIEKSKTALGALSVTWATQSSQSPQQARLPCNKHQLSYDGTDPPRDVLVKHLPLPSLAQIAGADV